MNFLTAVHTDVGIRKKTNQDSALIMEATSDYGNALLAVICDGMGGLAKGEVASSAVIQLLKKWFEEELPSVITSQDPKTLIFSSWEKIVYSANIKISEYGRAQGISLGTTLVAVLFLGNAYYIVNVGDSRAYCISNNLYQLTKDQTFVQREMDMGRMTYEESLNHPQRNVLLQCIGASNLVEPDFRSGEFAPGQVFMLCSDGFRHVISGEELFEKLNPSLLNSEQAMYDSLVYLTELNKYRREQDNISAILIKTE